MKRPPSAAPGVPKWKLSLGLLGCIGVIVLLPILRSFISTRSATFRAPDGLSTSRSSSSASSPSSLLSTNKYVTCFLVLSFAALLLRALASCCKCCSMPTLPRRRSFTTPPSAHTSLLPSKRKHDAKRALSPPSAFSSEHAKPRRPSGSSPGSPTSPLSAGGSVSSLGHSTTSRASTARVSSPKGKGGEPGEGVGSAPAVSTHTKAQFAALQRNYMLVFLTMMAADWLQGPYVYALYEHYGFSQVEIGYLFIAGFVSSLLFGTIVGSAADRYGRKALCIFFGVLYSACCLTKHMNNYDWLIFGRMLGGVSTSILLSSFEAWIVHEHRAHAFPEHWLALTFSQCTFGNGVVAIVSGILASVVRDAFGPVAPFDAALVLLVIGTAIIAMTWPENHGDARVSVKDAMARAVSTIRGDGKVFLLGVIQSSFEGGMHIFVFMWTPALETTSATEVRHGWVFASFMMGVLIGSTLFDLLLAFGFRVERFSTLVFGIAAMALAVPTFSFNHDYRLAAFVVFEVCCGVFWPSLAVMRSHYIPCNVRASVMNLFRMPLNGIVVLVLANLDKLDEAHVFKVASSCMCLAAFAQFCLFTVAENREALRGKRDLIHDPEATQEVSELVSIGIVHGLRE